MSNFLKKLFFKVVSHIWFMFVTTSLKDSTSNTTSAMYTVNLRIRNHLEQKSSPLFKIRQRRLCCSIILVTYRHRGHFSGLREKHLYHVTIRSAKYVTTPPHPTPPIPAPPHHPTPSHAPPHPAPCLHITHPVFNQVSPTTHSSNASVARGDTKTATGIGRVPAGKNC